MLSECLLKEWSGGMEAGQDPACCPTALSCLTPSSRYPYLVCGQTGSAGGPITGMKNIGSRATCTVLKKSNRSFFFFFFFKQVILKLQCEGKVVIYNWDGPQPIQPTGGPRRLTGSQGDLGVSERDWSFKHTLDEGHSATDKTLHCGIKRLHPLLDSQQQTFHCYSYIYLPDQKIKLNEKEEKANPKVENTSNGPNCISDW